MPLQEKTQNPAKSQKPLNLGTQFRAAHFDAGSVNEDDLTVELSFSSEIDVIRPWGVEVLGHKRTEVDLEFLASGSAPFLDGHNPGNTSVIGVIQTAKITDRRGKAVVRFDGNSELGRLRFAQVKDGILSNVSVGYRIQEVKLVSQSDGVDTYRATKWRPNEISLVSIPADASVGVGRSDDTSPVSIILEEESRMPDPAIPEVVPTPAPAAAPQIMQRADPAPIDPAKLIAEDRQRVAEINNIAAKFEVKQDLRDEAIRDGASADQFANSVLSGMDRQVLQTPAERSIDIGLTDKEVKNFSFVRAINALGNPGDSNAQEGAAFERECSAAASKAIGQSSRGFMVPTDVMKRDLVVGTPSAGGDLVATDLLSGSFIDMLQKRMAFLNSGAHLIAGLNGNAAIPRQTGGATMYWVGENGAPTESQQTIDQVALTPKTAGAYTEYSRLLTQQSSIDVESFVRKDLVKTMAMGFDLAAAYGSGAANNPTGIKNVVGINSVLTGLATDPSRPTVIDMETKVSADDADVDSMSYVFNATMRGILKNIAIDAGSGRFLLEGKGKELNGYGTKVTNQMSNDEILFGNFSDLIIGMWGGLDILLDPYSNSTTGATRIVVFQSVDFAVRHPESFCLSTQT